MKIRFLFLDARSLVKTLVSLVKQTRQTRTNEKSGWCMGCRCVSDLTALEFRVVLVTEYIMEHRRVSFV